MRTLALLVHLLPRATPADHATDPILAACSPHIHSPCCPFLLKHNHDQRDLDSSLFAVVLCHTSCRALEELWVSNNRIEDIREIGHLHALPFLHRLLLSGNRVCRVVNLDTLK